MFCLVSDFHSRDMKDITTTLKDDYISSITAVCICVVFQVSEFMPLVHIGVLRLKNFSDSIDSVVNGSNFCSQSVCRVRDTSKVSKI